jgi:anti-anti-sigma factor
MWQMTVAPAFSSPSTNPVVLGLNPATAHTAKSTPRYQRGINIVLQGTILAAEAEMLRQYIKEISKLSCKNWTLQMKDLEIIDMRGLGILVRFARLLRKRGHGLMIVGIHPNVHAILKDLHLDQIFEWSN